MCRHLADTDRDKTILLHVHSIEWRHQGDLARHGLMTKKSVACHYYVLLMIFLHSHSHSLHSFIYMVNYYTNFHKHRCVLTVTNLGIQFLTIISRRIIYSTTIGISYVPHVGVNFLRPNSSLRGVCQNNTNSIHDLEMGIYYMFILACYIRQL